MAQQSHDAWVDIREIQHKHAFFYQIALGLVLVIVGVVIGAKLFPSDDSYGSNVYLNVMSVFATVVVLNRLAEKREEEREEKALKQRLVMEVGSQSNETAKRAVHELERRRLLWDDNGLLKEADLGGANLQGVNLGHANLQQASLAIANLREAILISANLRRASLWNANAQGANLFKADLQHAYLYGANLQGTSLTGANLQGADLTRANLQGAKMWGANLQGVTFDNAEFDEQTKLPDDTYWSDETDMTRFTDPQHPQFWRSDFEYSPAYRGDSPTP